MPIKNILQVWHTPQIDMRWRWIDRVPQMLAVLITGALERPIFNRAWHDFIGSTQTKQSHAWLSFMHPEDFEHFLVLWENTKSQGLSFKKECRILYHDGTYHWCLLTATAQEESQDWLLSCLDIQEVSREKRQISQKNSLKTRMKALTVARRQGISEQPACSDHPQKPQNLMDWERFKQHAMLALASAKQQHLKIGLMLIDLQALKLENAAFSWGVDSDVLLECARRIQHRFWGHLYCTALGTDKLAVLLPNIVAEDQVLQFAQEVLLQLGMPINPLKNAQNASIWIGCACFPLHDSTFSGLMHCAEIALNDVKQRGWEMTAMFNAQMQHKASALKLQLARAREIIRHDLIVPHYQPKICLTNEKVIGFEALLRWHDTNGAIQYPVDIFEGFQHYETAIEFSRIMQEKVFQDIADWRRTGHAVVPVSVNLSPIEFIHDDCAEQFLSRLAKYDLPSELIQIEMTEHLFLAQSQKIVARALNMFRANGIKIALDDFGTGHSSLKHLCDYKVDFLKIDCQFVQRMTQDPAVYAVVKSICQLGKSLSLDVIAEGVETVEQKDMLLALGCECAQGFLYYAGIGAGSVPQILQNGIHK